MFQKYSFPKNTPLNIANVEIISFSYTSLTSEPSLQHSHPYTEIIIPKNNNGILLCGANQISCQSNYVYIISPNISHTEYNENNYSTFDYFVVKIQNILINNPQTPEEVIVFPLNSNFYELLNYCNNALKYLTPPFQNENLVILNLSSFYYLFIELINKSNFSISRNFRQKTTSSLIQEIKYYISKNYSQNINMEKLAEQFCISHSTLTKKFKAELGLSPKDYLLQKRMENAQSLLSTTDMTISQIASMCGFTSAAYFIYYFKKMYLLPPKKWKEENKKGQ